MSTRNVDSLLSELDGMLGDDDNFSSDNTNTVKSSYRDDMDIDSLLSATEFSSSSKKREDTSKEVKHRFETASSSKTKCELICLNCDFKVLKFDKTKWSESATYLFFRNYMPDTDFLSEKLERSDRHVSYCCQCAWQTILRNDKYSISNARSGTADGKNVRWVGEQGESWKTLI